MNKIISPPNISEAEIERQIKLHPDSPAAYCDRGDSYNCAGEAEAALKDYDSALKLNPHFARALLGKSLAFDSEGNAKEALVCDELAIKQNDPTVMASAIMQRILLLSQFHRDKEAIPEYLKLIESNNLGVSVNDKRNLYYQLATLYLKLKEPDNAFKILPKTWEGLPAMPTSIYVMRARVYRDRGKFKESLADYGQAIALYRHETRDNLKAEALLGPLYKERAQLYDKLGKHALAAADRRALAALRDDSYSVVPFQSR